MGFAYTHAVTETNAMKHQGLLFHLKIWLARLKTNAAR
jgi:hypothetical protein